MPHTSFKPNWQGMIKFFFDKQTPLLPKAFALLAFAYLVWPMDLFPDFIPFFGWLDDLGLVAVAISYLSHATNKYIKHQERRILSEKSGKGTAE